MASLTVFTPHLELIRGISPQALIGLLRSAANILVSIDRLKELQALENLAEELPSKANTKPSNTQLKTKTRERELKKVYHYNLLIVTALIGGIAAYSYRKK